MTESAVVFTQLSTGIEAGHELGNKITEKLGKKKPNVVILFASSVYHYSELIQAVKESCQPEIMIGSSSAGEFTSEDFGTDSACAVAIYSTDMKFAAGIAEGISANRETVAEKLCQSLQGTSDYSYQYQTGMLFADALSGYSDELIDLLTEKTMGRYQFFGGGAGDNANFKRTHVFMNDREATDAAVMLEILSNKPIGIGISHGWKPVSEKMRVTEADGMRLISLNARPVIEVFQEHAQKTNQPFDITHPVTFFLHNILGIEMADGYKLRAPLKIEPDGSVILASDIPAGAYVNFMGTDDECSRDAAFNAVNVALQQLGPYKPSVALFFDCVATRLRMGKAFDFELDKVSETLKGINFVGCNTYGQVARLNGQFNGFQNCNAIVCVIPE